MIHYNQFPPTPNSPVLLPANGTWMNANPNKDSTEIEESINNPYSTKTPPSNQYRYSDTCVTTNRRRPEISRGHIAVGKGPAQTPDRWDSLATTQAISVDEPVITAHISRLNRRCGDRTRAGQCRR